MSGIPVSVCRACGWRGFPARLWCPRCGADHVGSDEVESGVVEARTTLRRAAGRVLDAPVEIATVALAGGGRAVVRVDGAGGARVATTVEDGAPVARPLHDEDDDEEA
ncbi:MAG TPA: hypothetical protein VLB86_11005 [Gaiellaceae bacterium]|nr:hypothetical protein [Gaiellaceae bacterium]